MRGRFQVSESAKVLEGHSDEIFSCAFNYEGDTVITGSKDTSGAAWSFLPDAVCLRQPSRQDNTCRIWKDNFFTPADEDDQWLGKCCKPLFDPTVNYSQFSTSMKCPFHCS